MRIDWKQGGWWRVVLETGEQHLLREIEINAPAKLANDADNGHGWLMIEGAQLTIEGERGIVWKCEPPNRPSTKRSAG